MLKRRVVMLALGFGLLVSVSYAQRKVAPKPAKPASAAPKKVVLPVEEVSLAGGSTGGTIAKSAFLKELAKPLHTNGQVESFNFTYAERNMYEDSAGNPLPLTDFLVQTCSGDTLMPVVRESMKLRCKAGDTAFYDQIRIRRPDGSTAQGKPMKFAITW